MGRISGIDIRLLGPIECFRDGKPISIPGTSARAVLALLALRRRAVVFTDELVEALWGHKIPADPTAALYVTVCRLRRALGEDRERLRRVPHGYQLDVDDVQVDVGRVESLLASGLARLEQGESLEAETMLTAALAEWRHDAPLAELADLPFATLEASRLIQLRCDVLTAANDSSSRAGHPTEVIARTERFLGLDPWHEDLVLQLMTALNDTGRKADALRTYARLASSLRAEFGIEPSAELQALRNSMLGNGTDHAEPASLPAWFQASLEDLGASETDPALRCRMMLALGEAEHYAGLEGWQETLIEAGELARSARDIKMVARCALGGAMGWTTTPGQPDQRRIQLMTCALEGDIDVELRISLLGAYADELAFTADLDKRMHLTDSAVALARSAGKPAFLLRALNQRFNAIWAPETLQSRRRDAEEACQLADATVDPRAAAIAAGYAMAAAIEEADLEAVDRHLAGFTRLAERLDLPVFRWGVLVHSGWRSVVAGDLDRAEQLAEEARRYGATHGRPEAELVYISQRSALRWQQGRLGEEVESLHMLVTELPSMPGFRAVHALGVLQAGRTDEARQVLISAWDDGSIEALPHDQMYLTSLVHWSEVAAATDETRIAQGIYPLLAPYWDRVAFNGSAVHGPVARALTRLAEASGDRAAAEKHVAQAQALASRMKSPVFA